MDQKTYLANVLTTESKPETANLTNIAVDMLMTFGTQAGEVMNRMKRIMFYGKAPEKNELLQALSVTAQFAEFLMILTEADALQDEAKTTQLFTPAEGMEERILDKSRVNLRLLHGVIGQMSEAAEKLEALQKQGYGQQLDLFNYGEEMGDDAWYDAIQKDELQLLANAFAAASGTEPFDFSEEALRARNIKKLQDKKAGRYKAGAFNAAEAINRDVAAERVILEENDTLAEDQ